MNTLRQLFGNLGAAALVGLSSFLPVWVTTQDEKTLAVAFLGPVVSYLLVRYRIDRAAAPPA